MTNSWRFSTLIDRHRALGSDLEDWSGMGTAWSYSKGDPDAEYMAIRTKAGLMDVSGLKKVHITGPAASHVIERATTRNMEKLMPGRSVYATMLNDAGKFIDDCVIYRMAPNAFMVVHGSGQAHEQLTTTCMTCRCRGRWRWSIWKSMCRGSGRCRILRICRPASLASRR
jgi:aminomethyltransferase